MSSAVKGRARTLSMKSMDKAPPAGSTAADINKLDLLRQILGSSEVELENADNSAVDVASLSKAFSSLGFSATSATSATKTDLKRTNLPQSLEEIRHSVSLGSSESSDATDETYRATLQELEELRSNINSAVASIDPLATYLHGFHSRLAGLSQEMEALQERSEFLLSRAEKRAALEEKLRHIVAQLAFPPQWITIICDATLTPETVSVLLELDKKKSTVAQFTANLSTKPHLSDPNTSQPLRLIATVEEFLDLLIQKAVETIRDFLASQIRHLRVPGTNAQHIQQELLKVRQIFPFLRSHHPRLAQDLQQAYVNTMRWYYSAGFRRYRSALEKLAVRKAGREVLLGSSDTSEGLTAGLAGSLFAARGSGAKSGVSGSTNAVQTPAVSEYLSAGARADLETEPAAMPSQIAETTPKLFWPETGFRNWSLVLVDNVCVEYQFCIDFFAVSGEQCSATVNEIFSQTYSLGHGYTQAMFEGSFDAVGMLVCIRTVQGLLFELQRRRVPAAEDYFNYQLILLWPRFQHVMDANCENIRKTAAKSSFFSVLKHSSGTGPVLHPLTVQFGSFLSIILRLSRSTADLEFSPQNEPVANSLTRLRNEFESAITKASAALPEKPGQNNREAFLLQNYAFLLRTAEECGGVLADEERKHFELLVEAYRSQN